MKTRNLLMTAAVLTAVLAFGGESNAAGRGASGGGYGVSSSTTQVRPAGSQRRDGTFLTTGTTANGSTTRNGNGTGLQNGTCILPAPTAAPVQ